MKMVKIANLPEMAELPGPGEMLVPVYKTIRDADPSYPIRKCTIEQIALSITGEVMKTGKIKMRICNSGIVFEKGKA
jgi:hypothetical protein